MPISRLPACTAIHRPIQEQMTYKKISARRLVDIAGPRRKKPPIQQQNRELKALLAREHELLQALVEDAHLRRALWLGSGRPLEPLAVWTDFDRSYRHTEVNPNHLVKWTAVSEYMKLQLGFLVALKFGGFAFTVNVHPSLEARWRADGLPLPKIIQKRCWRELDRVGLKELPYAYVVEGRSRSGKSRTHVHIHGYLLAEDPLIATRFTVAMERALLADRRRLPRTAMGIDLQRVYDTDTKDGRGYGRWVSYSTKNVGKWDARLKGRRVFLSQPLTQITRDFWELLRTDPFGG